MKHLVKIYEETKKLNNDLTQYEFSTDFLNKKNEKTFNKILQKNLEIFEFFYQTLYFLKDYDNYIYRLQEKY